MEFKGSVGSYRGRVSHGHSHSPAQVKTPIFKKNFENVRVSVIPECKVAKLTRTLLVTITL